MEKNNLLLMFLVMFITGFCGLLYEVVFLLLSTIMVGASAVATSIVLSLFLLGLSLGALFGGYLSKDTINPKIILGMANCLAGAWGFSCLFLVKRIYLDSTFWGGLIANVLIIVIIPFLNGINIPLAVKILTAKGSSPPTGFVYFANTLGSVLGALLSGLLIIPTLGFHGTFLLGALLNLLAGLLVLNPWRSRVLGSFMLLLIILFSLFKIDRNLEALDLNLLEKIYGKTKSPIYSTISNYQHIMITHSRRFGRQLYLNGEIQVSEYDSKIYHEFLLLPAITAHPNPKTLLIIGDGDGGALSEALKYNFSTIHHVEIDPKVIEVSKKSLNKVHNGALDDKRIKRFIMDGRQFIKKAPSNYYDIIIVALPDPYKLELCALYSKEFYALIFKALTQEGVMITQTGDFLFRHNQVDPRPQNCILKTIKTVFQEAALYRVSIPSWGYNTFIIASRSDDPRVVKNKDTITGLWYQSNKHRDLFDLPSDLKSYLKDDHIAVNTDTDPVLHLYMHPTL